MLVNLLFMSILLGNPPTIGIIVFDDVLTSEVTAPAEVFGMAIHDSRFSQWKMHLISASSSLNIRTAEGLQIRADVLLTDAPSVDALIVPGAYDTDNLRKHEALIAYIRAQKGWIASNCSGAFILGQAGILDGKKATTWPGGEADLQKAFPEVEVQTGVSFVMDGKRLTSNGGLVSYDAAFVLLAQLAGKDLARQVYKTLNSDRLRPWDQLESFMDVPKTTN